MIQPCLALHVRRVACCKIYDILKQNALSRMRSCRLQKKLLQRYTDGNCFIDIIVIVYGFYNYQLLMQEGLLIKAG